MGVELGEGHVLWATENAIKVLVEGEEIWIPKTVLSDEGDIDENAEKDDEGIVAVRTWWAEQEGWA